MGGNKEIDTARKRAFLVRQEMYRWLTAEPDLSPDALVERAAAWLIQAYDLGLDEAMFVARVAFVDLAANHERVAPDLEMMHLVVDEMLSERPPESAVSRWISGVDAMFTLMRDRILQ